MNINRFIELCREQQKQTKELLESLKKYEQELQEYLIKSNQLLCSAIKDKIPEQIINDLIQIIKFSNYKPLDRAYDYINKLKLDESRKTELINDVSEAYNEIQSKHKEG